MLTNITIDSIMKDYYHCIHTDKLSDDKINIDENLIIEDSMSRYLIEFALFLNKSYYMGYVISEPTLKRFMDIINYEGYEYQLIKGYIDILLNNMNDYHIDDENRYIHIPLTAEESKEFINKYIQAVQDIGHVTLIDASKIPKYYKIYHENIGSTLYLLEEVEYPIDIIFKKLLTLTSLRKKDIIDNIKVLYENNIEAYLYLLKINESCRPYYLSPLFYKNDNKSLDILTEYITSIDDLYETFMTLVNYETSANFKLNHMVNLNIMRLINLLTINITIDQVALMISHNLKDWKEYYESNDTTNYILNEAILLNLSNNEGYNLNDPLYRLKYFKDKYSNDVYFYTRSILLNIDYKIFCEHFHDIFYNILEENSYFFDLIKECFDGFISLRVEDVDNKLIELYNNNINSDSSSGFTLLLLYLKDSLINRNGKFNTEWLYRDDIKYTSYFIPQTDDIVIDSKYIKFIEISRNDTTAYYTDRKENAKIEL